MRRTKTLLVGALVLAAGLAHGAEELEPTWKHGLRFQGETVKLKLGGRLMYDTAYFSGGDLDAGTNGMEVRRARLYGAGRLAGGLGYKLQLDFAKGKVALKDAYLRFALPWGRLTVGHVKEPVGLEELTSSKYVTFMERALPMTLAPSRNAGVLWSAHPGSSVLALGAFRPTDGHGKVVGEGSYDLAARFAYAPIADGEHLVHLGLGGVYGIRNGETVDYAFRPEVHLADKLVRLEVTDVDRILTLIPELALGWGPLSLEGSYAYASLVSTAATQNLSAYAVALAWRITGEARPYKHGTFKRLAPARPLGAGAGAFEVAVRYSAVRTGDARLQDLTAGLNWYPIANARLMLNLVLPRVDGMSAGEIVAGRVQVDF